VNTLGLKYDGQACVIDREQVQTTTVMKEKVNLGAAHGEGEPAMEEVEIEEEVIAKCEGRLLEIKAAPSRLTDDEWMQEAEHADDLAETWRQWREKVDDLPDPDPWDEAG